MLQIIGAGGFAREIQAYSAGPTKLVDTSTDPIPVIDPKVQTIIAIGDPAIRKKIASDLEGVVKWGEPINFGKSYGGNKCKVGVIICPGTYITTNVTLGKHVIVNLNCTIGHDTDIGDFTTISPGANISGNVIIGDECYIGTNAVIKEKIHICNNVVIGAGAVVVKNINEPGTYVGNPAKKIK